MAPLAARVWSVEGGPAAVARAVLRTYAAVLFSRSAAVGGLLFLATAMAPRVALGGVLGVLAALATALLFDLDREAMRDGSYSVSALLLGLGVAQTLGMSAAALLLLITLSGLSALFTAALRAYLASNNLPTLSLPFLILFYLLLGLLPVLGLSYTTPHADASTALPSAVLSLLRSVGALLFLPRWDTGLLLLLALVLHSRIAALLAFLAAASIALLKLAIPALALSEHLTVLTFNAIFSAIALGGVWFVPSPSSLLLSLGGVILCVLFTLGGAGPLAQLGLPVLIVPFNATVLLVLLASRQRAWDRRPKSVDFVAGTPEQNLAYFRTRLLRFRWLYPTRFRLPVRGTWSCTQGVDGELSHQGRYRHAFDFEVTGPDGRLHAEEVPVLKDYYCYRLPVLAAAAGVVAKVENAVPDNEAGGLNLEQNWGNYVILFHAPGLYSMVAHLQRGSVKVVEGQSVRQGELLGLCGNSGRSPRPHVHFQLQTGNRAGDPTLPCRFTDAALVTAEAETVVADLAPEKDQQVRNLEYDADRASFFVFPYRAAWRYRIGKTSEQLEIDIDATGQLLLRTSDRSAQLCYSLGDGFFTTYDAAGATSPALHILRAALSRVPLDAGATLRWRDYLAARQFRGRLWGLLSDVVSPFLHRDAIEMEYQMQPEGLSLVVSGESRLRDRRGQPVLRTRVELSRGDGPLRAAITLRGRTVSMEREFELPNSVDQDGARPNQELTNKEPS